MPRTFDPRSQGLRMSLVEGALHAVMVGLAESYLGAFAVELGHQGSELALLATLPMFLGALAQLSSPAAARMLRSRKRLVLAGATVQALSLAGFVVLAALATPRFAPLLAVKCLFWASAGIIVPSWNAWMGDLTDLHQRPRYFARRSGLNHAVLLVAFAGAGLMLQTARDSLLDAYGLLFALALTARLASVLALGRQYDPAPRLPRGGRASRFRFRAMLARSDFKVARYLALLSLGTQVAGPFFTPFMLRELGLGYGAYAALSALSILAKAVSFPVCERLASLLGLRLLMVVGGFSVTAIPLGWAVSTAVPSLIVVHLFGGAAWAAVEYASFQLQLSSCKPRVAAEFFAVSNSLSGAAAIVGAILGGWLLERGWFGYQHVFLVSAALRGVPLIGLLVALRGGELPREVSAVYSRILSVRPGAGASQRPILMSSPDED